MIAKYLGSWHGESGHARPGHVPQQQASGDHRHRGLPLQGQRRNSTKTEDLFRPWAGDTAVTKMVCNQQSSLQVRGGCSQLSSALNTERTLCKVEHYTNLLNSAPGRVGRPKLDIHNIIYWFKNTRAALRRAEIRKIRSSTFEMENFRSKHRTLEV